MRRPFATFLNCRMRSGNGVLESLILIHLTFMALDLQHITDFGTTWQTCHDFHRGSEQFEWYKKIMNSDPQSFAITLHNAKNDRIRAKEDGEWSNLFQKGTAAITGYGYFSERAEVNGFPYFNTSLKSCLLYT